MLISIRKVTKIGIGDEIVKRLLRNLSKITEMEYVHYKE